MSIKQKKCKNPEDTNWSWNVFDHKWNNLKRWVECCEKEFGKEGTIKVGRMGDMMRTIEEGQHKIDDLIIEQVLKESDDNSFQKRI